MIQKGLFVGAFLFYAVSAMATDTVAAVDAAAVNKESQWPTILLEQGSLVDFLPKNEATQHWTNLPIWGAEAEHRGYVLEPPLVLGV